MKQQIKWKNGLNENAKMHKREFQETEFTYHGNKNLPFFKHEKCERWHIKMASWKSKISNCFETCILVIACKIFQAFNYHDLTVILIWVAWNYSIMSLCVLFKTFCYTFLVCSTGSNEINNFETQFEWNLTKIVHNIIPQGRTFLKLKLLRSYDAFKIWVNEI